MSDGTLAILGNALDRALDDAVEDRLLERVVGDRPGEEQRPCVARGGREVELRGQTAGVGRVQRAG